MTETDFKTLIHTLGVSYVSQNNYNTYVYNQILDFVAPYLEKPPLFQKSIQIPRAQILPLEEGQRFYTPQIPIPYLLKHKELVWKNDTQCRALLELGLVYLTSEEANSRTEAMLTTQEGN